MQDWTCSNEKAVASLLHTLQELRAELSASSPAQVGRAPGGRLPGRGWGVWPASSPERRRAGSLAKSPRGRPITTRPSPLHSAAARTGTLFPQACPLSVGRLFPGPRPAVALPHEGTRLWVGPRALGTVGPPAPRGPRGPGPAHSRRSPQDEPARALLADNDALRSALGAALREKAALARAAARLERTLRRHLRAGCVLSVSRPRPAALGRLCPGAAAPGSHRPVSTRARLSCCQRWLQMSGDNREPVAGQGARCARGGAAPGGAGYQALLRMALERLKRSVGAATGPAPAHCPHRRRRGQG
ncbi:hypothetical protein J0S82_007139 [Galemys pyrenaicus]|uniref:Uncharacterized protein n=1 Tax=Galemys pyrenaicus TaxID=202257 RepID=A0A8J6A9M7_GALPY|nr:hypothetical protein J0S82_007139 [Galemys pyrenaicus]